MPFSGFVVPAVVEPDSEVVVEVESVDLVTVVVVVAAAVAADACVGVRYARGFGEAVECFEEKAGKEEVEPVEEAQEEEQKEEDNQWWVVHMS
jgi:hypothetical protein